MVRRFPILSILFLAASFVMGMRVQAQNPPHPTDPAVSQLAARIAQPLEEAHLTKVIVADLNGPDGQTHPVAKWLADQISDSLKKDFPSLEIVARTADETIPNRVEASDSAASDRAAEVQKAAKEWALKRGARIVITGSYAKFPQGIGVSLTASFTSGSQKFLSQTNGLVPISDEIAALSPEPVPSPKGGIGKAGVGGTGIPSCVHCPPPNYTDEARAAKLQGSVVLQVTITPDGHAVNISVVKGPGGGLEMKAIEAVRKWIFKPATGPDGNPAAVIVPIEVTFRLYNN